MDTDKIGRDELHEFHIWRVHGDSHSSSLQKITFSRIP